MQSKAKCYNKIYCSFKENGENCKDLLKESFIDYLKKRENEGETLENNSKES